MTGGIEETSASFEARSAPRSYPTGWLSGAGVRLAAWSDAWFQGPFAPHTSVHGYAGFRCRSVASHGGTRERMQVQPKSEPRGRVMPILRASSVSLKQPQSDPSQAGPLSQSAPDPSCERNAAGEGSSP